MKLNLKFVIAVVFALALAGALFSLTIVYRSFDHQAEAYFRLEAEKKTSMFAKLIAGSMQVADYSDVGNIASRLIGEDIVHSVTLVNQYGDVIAEQTKPGPASRVVVATETITAEGQESPLGTISIGYRFSYFDEIATGFKIRIIGILIGLVGAIALSFMLTIRYFQSIFASVAAGFEAVASGRQHQIGGRRLFSDVQAFVEDFNRTAQRALTAKELEVAKAKSDTLAQFAAQVAHDIRSPLSALRILERDLNQLPEEKRKLLNLALRRIYGIADDLLHRYRRDHTAATGVPSVQTLPMLIDEILTEKKMQYRDRDVEFSLSASTPGTLAKIDPIEFKRMLSNLINNSVEALPGAGKVQIRVAETRDHVALDIEDNGRGIPTEILDKIGEPGRSFGKANGSGLGLHHAKTVISEWEGQLQIESTSGKGTVIHIRLPRA